MTRFTSIKIILLASALTLATPAHAGFEFTPASKAAPSSSAIGSANAPMQLVPVTVPPVSEMPLDEAMMGAVVEGPDRDPVILPQKISRPEAVTLEPTQSVYVRRQKSPVPMQAQKAQPMDAEILLRATEPVAHANNALVINPYPLQEQAVHSSEMMVLPVEQAMMEEAGALRPVALPGHGSKAGMMARADISARHDRGGQYQNKTGGTSSDNSLVISSMTPIPGGEGKPLKALAPQVEEEVLPPVAIKTQAQQMPRPAIPLNAAPLAPENRSTAQTGYPEAVGFGRDLPLALALSQVVPADYSYAFSQDINVGTTVSWQGGKPWNEVLDDMLAPNGMRAVIDNNTITIQPVNS